MKTTVEIEEPLFRQVKAIAVQEGRNFRTLVEEGLRSVVEARSASVSEPFRIRDGSFRGGRGLRSGLKWRDLSALAYEDENPVRS